MIDVTYATHVEGLCARDTDQGIMKALAVRAEYIKVIILHSIPILSGYLIRGGYSKVPGIKILHHLALVGYSGNPLGQSPLSHKAPLGFVKDFGNVSFS